MIIALVPVGILVGSMLLGAADVGRGPGGGHGSGGDMEMMDHGDFGSSGSSNGHDPGDDMEMSDHSGDGHGASGEGHARGDQAGIGG